MRVSYSIVSWMNWKPGRPTASKDWWSVPPVSRIVSVVHADVVERLHPRLEDRRDGFVALEVDAANRAGAVVDVEVAGELGVIRLQRHGGAIAEMVGDVGA